MNDLLSYLSAGFWLVMSMLTAAPSDISVFELTPTTASVEEFLEQLDEPPSEWDGDCFSMMPTELMEKSGLQLFKYDGCCASVLVCEGEHHYLGLNFGGYGITSGALADMNSDGAYELYYTFSWGSGIHRGMVGSFDTATKQETMYDFSFWNGDLVLRANGDTLEVCEALMLNTNSYVQIRATPGRTLAALSFSNGEVTLTHPTTDNECDLIK